MIDGFSRLVLEYEATRTAFLPELGGKMVELTDKRTGTRLRKEPQVTVNWSSDESIGKHRDVLSWPYLTGDATKQSLTFGFNINDVSYPGIWLCYGDWPVAAEEKHLAVVLEPTTGRSDSLEELAGREEHAVVTPGSANRRDLGVVSCIRKGLGHGNNTSNQ